MQERCDHTLPTGARDVDEVSKAASAVKHENKPAIFFLVFWLNLTKNTRLEGANLQDENDLV